MNFSKLSGKVTKAAGHSVAFLVAMLLVIGWLFMGPYYHWSQMHSLFINTLTTIITFLMVFLIQNSQNKDSISIQIKLDELLRAVRDADNGLINLENLSDAKFKEITEKRKTNDK